MDMCNAVYGLIGDLEVEIWAIRLGICLLVHILMISIYGRRVFVEITKEGRCGDYKRSTN